jgi:gamma-glutamyltranspeptidase / glutathione hydrolase
MSNSKNSRITFPSANNSPKTESNSSKRNRWNRRDFMAGVGKGAVGVAVGASLLRYLDPWTVWAQRGSRFPTMSVATSHGGVVASASEQASRVGIDVLERGGNAVDAAIATIFAVGVTRPDFNGIGGGGFMVYRSRDGKVAALDFREFAPQGMTSTTLQGGGLHKDGGAFGIGGGTGHLTVGVPGTVAGMTEALRVLGSGKFFSLAPLISSGAPDLVGQLTSAGTRTSSPPYAYELARDGIRVTFELALFAFLGKDRLAYYPETARIYGGTDEIFLANSPNRIDVNPASGHEDYVKLKQEDYAKSLKLIMKYGAEAFYQDRIYPEGESIARLIVKDMEQAETMGNLNPTLLALFGPNADRGLLTLADFAAYRAVWRKPLVSSYRGHEIIALPPPSAGGVSTIEILNLLEGFPVGSTTGDVTDTLNSWAQSSANYLHVLAESQKIAWADREFFIADPEFVRVPTNQLISKKYADARRPDINLYEAKPDYMHANAGWAKYGKTGSSAMDVHTTSVSVLDRDGNAVSITHTINGAFGSVVVAPGTGFLLNNQLTDFNMDDPDSVNAPGARKRPRSSASPTIVARDGRAFLSTGGGGGQYIPLGVVQNIVNMIDFRLDVAHALDAERIEARAHGKEDITKDDGSVVKEWTNKLSIEHEAGENQRFNDAVLQALKDRKHVLNETGEYGGGIPFIEAVAWNSALARNEAASDPRHGRNFLIPAEFHNENQEEERGAAGQPD